MSKIIDQLKNLSRKLPNVIESALREIAEDTSQNAKNNCSVFKHNGPNGIRANIYPEYLSPTSVRVVANKIYASPLNWGSQPHEIKAVRAHSLRFYINGKAIFRKKVMHPGSKPTYFFSKAADWATANAQVILSRHIQQFISRL